MADFHPHQSSLLECISLEMQEEEIRYKLAGDVGLKQLRSLGVVLHPISVTRKAFGYADYPEISFRLPFYADTALFKENSAIECFIEGEDSIKGVFLGMDGQKGMFRLFAPEFPDWVEDKGVGIKLTPDKYTAECMQKAVKELEEHPRIFSLFESIHGDHKFGEYKEETDETNFKNTLLNDSQKNAVGAMLANDDLMLLHGPPGTGKTTTLIEGVSQQIDLGKKILVVAPSNAGVDNIAKGLVENKVKILRVGNSLKVDEDVLPFTSEGKMQEAREHKEIKKLRIRAEEFRRMAQQYKRNFGREDREQRSLLYKEVKRIRKEIREIKNYFNTKLFEDADVIIGTPIGVYNFLPRDAKFDILVIDEAGQAIEPLSWLVFPYANSWVLAGDPFQLPPTVLSSKAAQKGFSVSLLEHCFKNCQNIHFLDTQYRMRKSIADFSSVYFYEGKLNTPDDQNDCGDHIVFYDTAGTGFDEQAGEDGVSLMNDGELSIVQKILDQKIYDHQKMAFISPYAGQVQLAKGALPDGIRISTIDSFQGQEMEIIVLSLVRSNPDAIIGFLKDYRRLNVALTRAKERLVVIGDSSTIGQDTFYASFLEYMEKVGGYRSAWELMG